MSVDEKNQRVLEDITVDLHTQGYGYKAILALFMHLPLKFLKSTFGVRSKFADLDYMKSFVSGFALRITDAIENGNFQPREMPAKTKSKPKIEDGDYAGPTGKMPNKTIERFVKNKFVLLAALVGSTLITGFFLSLNGTKSADTSSATSPAAPSTGLAAAQKNQVLINTAEQGPGIKQLQITDVGSGVTAVVQPYESSVELTNKNTVNLKSGLDNLAGSYLGLVSSLEATSQQIKCYNWSDASGPLQSGDFAANLKKNGDAGFQKFGDSYRVTDDILERGKVKSTEIPPGVTRVCRLPQGWAGTP